MGTIEQQITSLADLDKCALKVEWLQHHQSKPPRWLSCDLLVRGIAHKLQVRSQGELSRKTQKMLQSLMHKPSAVGRIDRGNRHTLKPGVKLVREWGGKTHTVVVHEHGFEYAGEQHRSLSKIAREITGARWSGPRFFGLTKPPEQPSIASEPNNG